MNLFEYKIGQILQPYVDLYGLSYTRENSTPYVICAYYLDLNSCLRPSPISTGPYFLTIYLHRNDRIGVGGIYKHEWLVPDFDHEHTYDIEVLDTIVAMAIAGIRGTYDLHSEA